MLKITPIEHNIDLDFSTLDIRRTVIKQDSNRTHVLKIKLYDSHNEITLEDNWQYTISCRKADNTYIVNSSNISLDSNTICVEMTDQMLSSSGTEKCELIIYNDTQTLYSNTFYLYVEPNINSGNEIESTNEYSSITDVLKRVQEKETAIGKTYDELTDAVRDTQTIIEKNNVIKQNEENRIAEEKERQAQEEIRKTNEGNRIKAENQRTEDLKNLKTSLDEELEKAENVNVRPVVGKESYQIELTDRDGNTRTSDNLLNKISIGTVETGTADEESSATLTGDFGNQKLNLRLPVGKPFSISKTYPSISSMNSDLNNLPIYSFVMIHTGNVEDEDTGKLFMKDRDGMKFLTDLSGVQGIQGIKGATGATPKITIGTVTTGSAGSSASVTISGTAENPVINFKIPRGDTGSTTDADTVDGKHADDFAPAITFSNLQSACTALGITVKSYTTEAFAKAMPFNCFVQFTHNQSDTVKLTDMPVSYATVEFQKGRTVNYCRGFAVHPTSGTLYLYKYESSSTNNKWTKILTEDTGLPSSGGTMHGAIYFDGGGSPYKKGSISATTNSLTIESPTQQGAKWDGKGVGLVFKDCANGILPTVHAAFASHNNLGNSAFRFGTIYSIASSLNSDKKQKKDIVTLKDEELDNLIRLFELINFVKFRWKDNNNGALETNPSCRYHYGIIAQEIEELMHKLGITNYDNGFIHSEFFLANYTDCYITGGYRCAKEGYDYSQNVWNYKHGEEYGIYNEVIEKKFNELDYGGRYTHRPEIQYILIQDVSKVREKGKQPPITINSITLIDKNGNYVPVPISVDGGISCYDPDDMDFNNPGSGAEINENGSITISFNDMWASYMIKIADDDGCYNFYDYESIIADIDFVGEYKIYLIPKGNYQNCNFWNDRDRADQICYDYTFNYQELTTMSLAVLQQTRKDYINYKNRTDEKISNLEKELDSLKSLIKNMSGRDNNG